MPFSVERPKTWIVEFWEWMTEWGAVPDQPELESLASNYDADQHETYLRYLQKAVQGRRNLNIALTGRYGTGKSSVLDEFEAKTKRTLRTLFKRMPKTLRITISTLGVEREEKVGGEGSTVRVLSLTNQIQKELVKQLLYRASARDLRFSRFNRIVSLSKTRAFLQSGAVVAVVSSILWFLNLLPNVKLLPDVFRLGPDYAWLVRLTSWVAVGVLVATLVATVRLVIYGRFTVSDVSAAGATVKLSQRSATYFDEYLEDIVYFFDEVTPDVVIFEDLDRFDDPHIFEALRELNTLLNQTPKRRKRPVRFVYAIKDSLFERLGSDAKKLDDEKPAEEKPAVDAVAVETERANRTKFFDIVIPVVPFISHRNARELLVEELKKRGVADIDRTLLALVAQHATDMRLLKNICNEHVVFAKRLLRQGRAAPGLSASGVFALVAYKNFHLDDFERITRRDSALDRLYDRSRELVRIGIDECEKRKRDIEDYPFRHRSMAPLAEQLADRLRAVGRIMANLKGFGGWDYVHFNVDGRVFRGDEVSSYPFWETATEANQIVVLVSPNNDPAAQHQQAGPLDRAQIRAIFMDAGGSDRWATLDAAENREAVRRLETDIDFLRGADFQGLGSTSWYTPSEEDNSQAFSNFIGQTLDSELACDLVRQGFIDRNFALYAAQFYGQFSGVDVATFIVQVVETNGCDIDFKFSGREAVKNLLREAPEHFSRTVSAYNVQVVDYLLELDAEARRPADVAWTIVSNFGEHAQAFLTRYLYSGAQRSRLVTLLSAQSWNIVFVHLVTDDGVPDEDRSALVDAALQAANSANMYVLDSDVREFLTENYLKMEVFTTPQDDAVVEKVTAIVQQAGALLPVLDGLARVMRESIVHWDLYELTVENLRTALGTTGAVGFDAVRKHEAVYDRCKRSPDEYLAVLRLDRNLTRYAILTEETLVAVLNELPKAWDIDHARELISRTAPDSALKYLGAVPQPRWTDLAAHRLFRVTVQNVLAYVDAIGSFDDALAQLLVESDGINSDGADEASKTKVAIYVLNAGAGHLPEHERVELAASLELEDYISPDEIEPEGDGLLAWLLTTKLVKDSIESFTRFRSMGWSAFEPAISNSSNFAEFMTPDLLASFVADLLRSDTVPHPIKVKVLDNLTQYVPDNDAAALSAAGQYSLDQKRPLPWEQVDRVAYATRNQPLTLALLLLLPDLPPESLVTTLMRLGEPFSHLADNTEFKVPADDTHRLIVDRLKRAGVVVPRKQKDFIVVKPA